MMQMNGKIRISVKIHLKRDKLYISLKTNTNCTKLKVWKKKSRGMEEKMEVNWIKRENGSEGEMEVKGKWK